MRSARDPFADGGDGAAESSRSACNPFRASFDVKEFTVASRERSGKN